MKNKSKSTLKSNSCSPSSASTTSDEASSPECVVVPQRFTRSAAIATSTSKTRRPVMGITALMLNNYQKQTAMTSTGFTTTFPNVYLLGVPIVFNSTKIEVKQQNTKIVKSTRRRSKTTTKTTKNRRYVDANNNQTTDEGYKLEIYGENVNESIRV